MATREEWAERVQDWRQSGLTSSQYAAKKRLKAKTLLYWSSRLGREAAAGAFVEIGASLQASAGIEVVLENGVVVRVGESFDEAHLRRVVQAVGQ